MTVTRRLMMTHWTKPEHVLEYAELLASRPTHSAGVVAEIMLAEKQLQQHQIAQPLWRVLTTSVGLCSALRVLDLSCNGLDDSFWQQHDAHPATAAVCPSLTSLDLSNNEFTADSLEHLAAFVARCPALARCDLSLNPLQRNVVPSSKASGSSALFQAFERTRLRSLDLSCTQLTDQLMQELLACAFVRSLEKLYLRSNAIEDSGAVALVCILPSMKLQALSLAGNRIGNHGAAAFAFALDQTQTLAMLDLEQNQIDDQGLLLFVHVLKGLASAFPLRYLHLKHNRVAQSQLYDQVRLVLQEKILEMHIATAPAASGHPTPPRALVLSGKHMLQLMESPLADHFIKVALTTVRLCGRWNDLEELNLSGNSIGNAGAYEIGFFLSLHPPLRVLDLSNNCIDDDGITGLAMGLEPNPTLKELNLYHNRITDEGAKQLYLKAFTSNLQRKIHLSAGNPLTSECKVMLTAIAQAHDLRKRFTKEFAHLPKLEFIGRSLRQYGAAAIVDMLLSASSECHTLDLSRNGLGDAGAVEIARLLSNFPQLLKLDVSFNDIGDTGARAIADSLVDNKTLTSLSLHSSVEGSLAKPKLLEPGLIALTQALHCHPAIVTVDLRDNLMNSTLAQVFVTLLKKNPRIQKFNGSTAAVFLSRYEA